VTGRVVEVDADEVRSFTVLEDGDGEPLRVRG
jgi:hypothetical protein